MRGPESVEGLQRIKSTGTKGQRGKAKSGRTTKGVTRPRVPGSKALARQLFFVEQRQIGGERGSGATLVNMQKTARVSPPPSRSRSGKRNAQAPSLMQAFTRKAELDRAAAATPVAQSWQSLGPFSTPHGQTYGSGPKSRPSISGRVAAIAIDPSNHQHILLGAAAGGVWESTDAGKTWAPRTDDQPSLAMGALAFTSQDPSIVYAGTGEGDSTFPSDPTNLLGAGLLRSTDGGTTWAVHATTPFDRTGFYDIFVDPLNSNHLLVGTTTGLFESTNGGTSWSQRRAQRTWSLSIHPPVPGDATSTKEVFAGCADGVFRSTNGGSTWTKVSLPSAPSTFDRIEVCFAPSDGNVAYVFAAGDPQIPDPTDPQSEMPTPYVWRRGSAGGTFARITSVPNDLQTGQAWYDWFAAVAPNNPNVLYLGGINAHKGIRSATGSWTWGNLTATSGDSAHPDQHAIAFSPSDPNVVYLGNDGGVYRSPDGGTHWESLNKGLCITEVEFLAQHPQFDAWILAGLQDNGTVRYQGQGVWFHVEDGDGGDCGINQSSPNICYHSFYGIALMRSTQGGSWNSWQEVNLPLIDGDNYPQGALFYPPLDVNNRVVARAGRAVFLSRDSGTNWVRKVLPSTARLASALAIPTADRVYVGTVNGNVFRVDFSGGQWQTPVPLSQPTPGFISDMLVDPSNTNRLYVTYQASASGRVFRSDDSGAHWINITAGLPNIGINAIEIDPTNSNNLFVAADLGVYRSINAGTSWTALNNGLPNCLVKDLLFHAPPRLLRAGTQARGVWEIAVDQATIPDVEIYLRDNVVDTGRLSPSPSNVDDPFHFGAKAHWFQCPDIKIDSPSFQRPSAADVDFEVFTDDESMRENGIEFRSGLLHENAQRNLTVRVFVQVHNRGVKPATNVAVKVFFTAAAVTLPNLSSGFWTNFPNNSIPAAASWQPVADHKLIPRIDAGGAQILNFDWPVPATAPSNIALLSIISADNDSIATTELNVANLVQSNKKCGLKNITVVNLSPTVSPNVMALPIAVGRTGTSKTFAFEADKEASRIVRGVVLSKRLSTLARKAKLKRIKLTNEDKEELARIVASSPTMKGTFDLATAYAIGTGQWLSQVSLNEKQSDMLIALINPHAVRGYGSLVQTAEDGSVVGGVTLQAL